jgi:glycine dehydrogenase subunit 1
MALAATVYLSAMGKNGIRSVADSTVRNTQYAMTALASAGGTLRYPDRKVFGEFVLDLPIPAEEAQAKLLAQGILPGLPLGPYYKDHPNSLLVALTELRTKEEIDAFAAALCSALSG